MSRPAPRRQSRTNTPRPRKIAGRDAGPLEPDAAVESAPVEPAAPVVPPKPPKSPKPPVAKKPEPEDSDGSSLLDSDAMSRVLLVLVGVFVVLLVLQGVWFYVHQQTNDDRAATASRSESDSEKHSDDDSYVPLTVPSGRPVVLNEVAVQEGVDAAAGAAQIMFARDFKSYDDGVDNAVTLMTDDFAQQYRATTDDVRREFINNKTQVQIRVVAQSVVRATDTELEALVFLNMFTIKGVGADASTTYTPYRAVLKMVHTDTGWLVDGVDTK